MSDAQVLKIWRTIWLGYKFTTKNYGLFLQAASIYIAFYTFRLFPYGETVPNALLPAWAYSILDPLFFAYFAVAWHRFILIDERPTVFHYGVREFKYFALAWSIYFMASLIFSSPFLFEPGGVFAEMEPKHQSLTQISLIPVAILVAGFCLIAPFFLPAISIGYSTKSTWNVWKDFGRNRSRFIALQPLGFGVSLAIFSLAVVLSAHVLRTPLWFILGKDNEFTWFGDVTISAIYLTEFIVALCLAIVSASVYAATITSISIAFGISVGRDPDRIFSESVSNRRPDERPDLAYNDGA